jgi:hypothetical protein
MPYESDDQGPRLIGVNEPMRFYDDDRNEVCRLYLTSDGRLASNCQIVSAAGAGGPSATTALRLNDLLDVRVPNPNGGDRLYYNSASRFWEPIIESESGGGGVKQSILTFPGVLEVGTNNFRLYNCTGAAMTISRVFLSVGTPPTGAAVNVTLSMDGSSVDTSSVASAAYTGDNTGLSIVWPNGSYISSEVTQIGSTVAGADLVVHVVH